MEMKDRIEIKDILGKKGKCAYCDKEGTWGFEPYELEVHDLELLICLCEECEDRIREEI